MTPAELARLHARCFTVPRPFTEAEFASLLAVPFVFLCTTQAGFALGRAIAEEAELLTLAVDPERRRLGHGGALLDTFQAEASRREARVAFLEVNALNHAAIQLYQGAGYVEAGRRPGYYAHPDGTKSDALVMQRSL